MSVSGKSASTSKTSNGKEQAGADVLDAATEVKDQISDQVAGLGHQVQQQVNTQFASQKDKLVDTLETVSLLLHQAGEHAELQDKATLAQYVDQAAHRVSNLTDTLREQDATQLLNETKNLATRQPLLFMGGALALGFVGARFLRASTPQPETTTTTSTTSYNPAADDLALDSGDQYGATGSSFGTTAGYGTDLSGGTTGYLDDTEGSFTDTPGTTTDSLYGMDDISGTEKS